MAPSATPYTASAGHEAALNRTRQGLRTATSMRVASAVRSATAPGAPTMWNRVLANEAPACIELIAMSNKRTDVIWELCGGRFPAVIRGGLRDRNHRYTMKSSDGHD